MNRRIIVIVCGTALLIAAAVAVVVASLNRRQPAPPPDVPVVASPAEVRVKAVERKPVRPMGSHGRSYNKTQQQAIDNENDYWLKNGGYRVLIATVNCHSSGSL